MAELAPNLTADCEPAETELARVQLELARATETLEKRSNELEQTRGEFEAALERANQVAADARKEADEAKSAKSDFLTIISHELRTPLHGIMGTLDLLNDLTTKPEPKAYLDTARAAADRLHRVVNDILDFSKIESGELEIAPTTTSVRELADEVFRALTPVAQEKGLEPICDIAVEIPNLVVLDPVRVSQILTNLLSNAIKFTSTGRVAVQIRLATEPNKTPKLCFDVVDTGSGIEPAVQKRLFTPFTQADGSMTRKHGGAGLGLAICRGLARLMGGELRLKSKVGQGSRFRFILPLVGAPSTAEDEHAGSADVLNTNVLVIDDTSQTAKSIVSMLGAMGATAEYATDGTQASWALQAASATGETPIQLIIVSESIGSTPYDRILRDLRQQPEFEDIPAVLVTSTPPQETPPAAVNATTGKPVDRVDLRRAVKVALGMPLTDADRPQAGGKGNAKLQGRVLLVDDDAGNRRIASAMLRKLGLDPDVVEDGKAAVDAVTQNEYDAVLMDVQMPVMDGLEATAAIRELASERRHVPVIALTANAMPQDREMCLSAGMDDYLAKPVRRARLREVLDRWLSESQWAKSDAVDPEDTILRLPGKSGPSYQNMIATCTEFLTGMEQRVETFTALHREHDYRGLAAHAHQLAQLSKTVGCARLSAVAGLVDKSCARGDYEAVDRYARRLPRVARDTASALSTFVNSQDSK